MDGGRPVDGGRRTLAHCPATVSVIICAYTMDRWDQLCAALSSVLEQSRRPDQVVLVVDHCADLLRQAREAFEQRGIEVVPSSGVAGLSGARNTGVARATGDVVAFLDDDAVAAPGWLEAHLDQYADPRVLGVGGSVTPRWRSSRPHWFPDEFGWVVGCSYVGQPTDVARIRNPIGANMSFRCEVIEAAGGFSAGLGRVGTTGDGCEETELSIRAAQLFPGGRIVHVPAAEVHHDVPPPRTTWSYFWRRCWAEGRSKARMSRMVGRSDALASERTYVRDVLPRGVRSNLARAIARRDVRALTRAGAISAGVVVTSTGFALGQVLGPRTTELVGHP